MFFKKIDIMILIAIILVTLVIYFLKFKSTATMAEITYDGEILKQLNLDKDQTFSLPEIPNITFTVEDNTIRFQESDCPDKICIKTGKLRHLNQIAACLPNRVSVRITD